MRTVEAEGRSTEAALAEALERLGAARDQVEIEVLAEATRGFLGIGAKKARVRVTRREPDSIETDEAPPPAPASRKPAPRRTVPTVSKETAEKVRHVLVETLRLMETPVPVSLRMQEGEAVLNLDETSQGTLIGRKGQTLDALEYLVNRMVTRGEEEEGHVTLDAEGYRGRRSASLESLALRLGERAKRRRTTVTLNPLNPRDRRVVHLALEDDPRVATRSLGRGYFRRLSIVPEDAAGTRRGRPRDRDRRAAAS